MAGGELSLSTSVSLIRRARALEPEAWALLTRLYGPLIYGWVRKSGLQSSDAADILQNVFVSVWRGLPRFATDRAHTSFRGWLRVITANAVREWSRRQETMIVSPAILDGCAAPDRSSAILEPLRTEPPEEMFSNLTHQALELVKGTVDARTWAAFWSSTVDEVPVAEVSEQLKMSAAAVRQAKYRVLCRLRELLADQ